MRTLLAIAVLVVLGWSGWWWFNATTRERVLENWLAERRAAGWIAEADDIRVTGFPNRVDTIVTGLELADPEAGWSWSAPEFEILSLSYKPNHIIAAWPGEQVFSTPYETVSATSDLMRGSVVFDPNSRLTLNRTTIEIENMAISGTSGWQATLGSAILATRQGEAPHAHDIAFEAENLVLPGADFMPETIGAARLDATASFDRDWDRPAVEAGNPVIEGVEIRDLSLAWGELDLRGRGTLDVDAEGFAEGRLDLRARNWRELIEAAEAAGAVPNGLAGPIRAGIDLIAALSGDPDSVTVPLDFEDGRARLGPVVIGAAPRIATR